MGKTATDRQREHRQRIAHQLERATRMESALKAIEAKLDGTEKPAALAILEIAQEGLKA